MRNLAQLKKECEKRGLTVPQSGKREAKSDFMTALRDDIWTKEFPGVPQTPQIEPMLANKVGDLKPNIQESAWKDNSGWVAQQKLNGCRGIALIGQVNPETPTFANTVISRRDSDKTYRKQEMTGNVAHIFGQRWSESWGKAILDGELMSETHKVDTRGVGKGGVVTANELQAAAALLNCDPAKSQEIQRSQNVWLKYYVFDILQAPDGTDLRARPYSERYALLEKLYLGFTSSTMTPGLTSVREHVVLVPIVSKNKQAFYEKIVREGGEGVMLKNASAPYKDTGRSNDCVKAKRFEEVDAYVTGFLPSEPESGWNGLIGSLELSCKTEKGEVHSVAFCSNLELEVRKTISKCGNEINGQICGGDLHVIEDAQALKDGKHTISSTSCKSCAKTNPPVVLDRKVMGKVYEVQGQEWTARSYRLKHAVITRERIGVDGKAPEECIINLERIQARFAALAAETGVSLQ